ncbi:MAG TPA: D-alanyl-D-alanine carboxypeptidase family protein, partial [Lysobacter sp.]
MHALPRLLLNTPDIEVWPAHLLRARSNAHARLLARARHVLRRKRDGRFLAAATPGGVVPMMPAWRREPGVDAALRR